MPYDGHRFDGQMNGGNMTDFVGSRGAFWGAAVLVAFLTTAALADEVLPSGAIFVCDEGVPLVQVVVPSDNASSPLLLLGSEQFEMVRTPMASGFAADVALGNNLWTVFSTDPAELYYRVGGAGLRSCVLTDRGENMGAGTASGQGDVVSAVGNFSLGGKVRSGPGMGFKAIDSLAYGEPVVLKSRSGVDMNGYEWFEIEYSEGLSGYQWGGIMCSNALHIAGLYDPCPSDLD